MSSRAGSLGVADRLVAELDLAGGAELFVDAVRSRCAVSDVLDFGHARTLARDGASSLVGATNPFARWWMTSRDSDLRHATNRGHTVRRSAMLITTPQRTGRTRMRCGRRGSRSSAPACRASAWPPSSAWPASSRFTSTSSGTTSAARGTPTRTRGCTATWRRATTSTPSRPTPTGVSATRRGARSGRI